MNFIYLLISLIKNVLLIPPTAQIFCINNPSFSYRSPSSKIKQLSAGQGPIVRVEPSSLSNLKFRETIISLLSDLALSYSSKAELHFSFLTGLGFNQKHIPRAIATTARITPEIEAIDPQTPSFFHKFRRLYRCFIFILINA